MAESYVQVPPDSNGKRLRSLTHDLGQGEVHSHTTALVDPATGDAVFPSTEGTLEAARAFLAMLVERTPKGPKDFLDGKYRTAGGKRQTSGTAGDAVLQLRNPSATDSMLITEFVLACDANADVQFHKNGTLTGTITNHEVFNPNTMYDGSGLPTIGVAESGDSITGGSLLSPIYRMSANITLARDFVYLIRPGGTVSVRIATGLTSANLYASATWIEPA